MRGDVRIGDVEGAWILPARKDAKANEYPDFLIIECAFATEHDRVYVYADGSDLEWRGSLMSTVDFVDDVWVFDRGADGSAQLIIRFSVEDEKATARLYDDRDGDGSVAFRLRQGELEITESKYWSLKIRSSNNGWLEDGLVNPNLSLWIDGAILRYLNWGEASPGREWALENVRTDGEVDWSVEVVDADEDRMADYQLQRLQADFPQDMPVFRSTLYANESDNAPIPYANYVFWPLLVSSHNYEAYNYFDHPPAISMAWDLGKIDRVGILGYPAENGYHINSRSGVWQKNRANYADFENPMAYYDLAEDADGQAELFVRLEVYAPGDRFFMEGNFPEAMTSVEYAWDQDNDGQWDYQLSLGGRQAVSSEVSWPDFSLLSVPYEAIPDWVMGQEWEATLWVAAENGGHRNSEGMSIWNVNRGFREGKMVEPSGLRNGYLTGVKDSPPLEDYSEIPEGFRGEWAFEHRRRPRLYLSAVDGRLHLAHVAGGVWSLEEGGEMRYANLDEDAYLDHWEYWLEDELREVLTLTKEYLLYSGKREVVIKKVDTRPYLFEGPPPGDQATWQALGGTIEKIGHDLSQTDLRAMLARIPGTESRIIGAEARGVRMMEEGFGLVLALEPEFEVEGEDVLEIGGLPSGDYWIEYAGEFESSAAIPASLEIAPVYTAAWTEGILAEEQMALIFSVRNTGHEDATRVRQEVEFEGMDGMGGSLWEGDAVIEIPAGESVEIVVPWMPERSGQWRVRVEARGWSREESSPPNAIWEGNVWVGEAETAGVGETLGAFGLVMPGTVWMLMAAMMAVGTLSGWACWFTIWRLDERRGQDQGEGG